MEEIIIEQPVLESDLEKFDNATHSETDQEIQDGSIIGRFKSAKNLLDAYDNLQAEFTRKSQKLAEFQKKYEENAIFKEYNSVDDFINETSDSKEFKDKILEIVNNDNDVSNLPNKYQVAFKIVKLSENNLAENLNNQAFLDKYIFSNQNIKNQIINNYLSNLNNISTLPKVLSGTSGTVYFSPNTDKPKTLKEAGEIFSKMLK